MYEYNQDYIDSSMSFARKRTDVIKTGHSSSLHISSSKIKKAGHVTPRTRQDFEASIRQ